MAPRQCDFREESIADLREHASISPAFETESVYDVRTDSGRLHLVERALAAPLRKDYDAFEDPLSWSRALRTTKAVRISALSRGRRVGGVIVAVAASKLVAWSASMNAAILWDLRVGPEYRRQSIASSLLRSAEAWARQHGCTELLVETQNTNPAACKFYIHSGFDLRDAGRGAYPRAPEEVQLIWGKRLDR